LYGLLVYFEAFISRLNKKNNMFSDKTMDLKKEEIEEKIYIDGNFLPTTDTVIDGKETKR